MDIINTKYTAILDIPFEKKDYIRRSNERFLSHAYHDFINKTELALNLEIEIKRYQNLNFIPYEGHQPKNGITFKIEIKQKKLLEINGLTHKDFPYDIISLIEAYLIIDDNVNNILVEKINYIYAFKAQINQEIYNKCFNSIF